MITVLEPTLGATAKKATLRLVGTCIGGCLACAILACAESANGGSWALTNTKTVTVSVLLSIVCGIIQVLRTRDPTHDYAYSVGMMTVALCTLGDFWQARSGA